ncbi:glycosyltransferase family 2 protein [Luteirhabdus pelagi]|uniref:glycosyltransferase family 2 protein n=1 Tax=Luteirhabdus pelagi TaxID=2792783 RepID=UPI0019399B91|nr:glycosyltransferase family 2 protein [Luteirhabdus pelagi]
MKVAIVILNWNGKALLERYLPSVVKHAEEATVYVADNASTDESVAYLQKEFPTIRILQNGENLGYAGGYNKALKSLSEDLFILMNNDIETPQPWLSPIVAAFQQQEKLVAAQPLLLDAKKTTHFEYAGAAGGYLDDFGYPYCRGRVFDTVEKNTDQYASAEIFWASGACLCVRKDSFWEVGGFDEDFFAHQEEIDLCWRLKARNGSIKCISESRVYHLGGGTLSDVHPKKTFLNFRNTLLMMVKNKKGWKCWQMVIGRMILDAAAATRFLLQGKFSHIGAILKAHLSFYRLLPTFLKKRKKCATHMPYYNTRFLVWQYFMKRRKQFNELR